MTTTTISGVRAGVTPLFNVLGTALRIRYFNETYGGGGSYYDDPSLTTSGTDLWTSGMIFPVGNKGVDAFLRQQGKVLEDDTKFYIFGNVQTSGTMRIGVGSPPVREYALIEPGAIGPKFGDNNIYKVCFGRFITLGSLYGE